MDDLIHPTGELPFFSNLFKHAAAVKLPCLSGCTAAGANLSLRHEPYHRKAAIVIPPPKNHSIPLRPSKLLTKTRPQHGGVLGQNCDRSYLLGADPEAAGHASPILSNLVTRIDGCAADIEPGAPEVEAEGVPVALATVPVARTSCPTCWLSLALSAFGGSNNWYVVPVLSVTVKLPAEPPRQPSIVSMVLAPASGCVAWLSFLGVLLGEGASCCATAQAANTSKMVATSNVFRIRQTSSWLAWRTRDLVRGSRREQVARSEEMIAEFRSSAFAIHEKGLGRGERRCPRVYFWPHITQEEKLV